MLPGLDKSRSASKSSRKESAVCCVGYTPARVIATAEEGAVEEPIEAAEHGEDSEIAALVRESWSTSGAPDWLRACRSWRKTTRCRPRTCSSSAS